MLKEIIATTYQIALPIVLGYIVWLLQAQKTERIQAERQQKKDIDASNRGTMLLLRVQLIEYHEKYMQRGEIPSYAFENFCEMYKAYHELGGNGMVTKMYEEIQQLHIQNKGA